MITGVVTADREAVIILRIRGPNGDEQDIEVIVDTGFNGYLTLPHELVMALGLTRRSRGRALLANGSEELFDIYGVIVMWDGEPRYVEADAIDATPLVGMSLLYGYDLYIQAVDGGSVTIKTPD
jgi:clan AA aspartic protease